MEPISLLLTAIVSGAAAALEPTTKQAVKDAYDGLKALIKRKWGEVGIESVERDPKSVKRRDVLMEDLEKAGAAPDEEVMKQAQEVIRAVKEHATQAAKAAGISLSELEAAGSINVRELVGSNISVNKLKAGQDINIEGLRSGNPPER
jgi:hypothetical protein